MGRRLHGHEPMHAQHFEVDTSDYDCEHDALAVALHRAADFIAGGVREDDVNFHVNAIEWDNDYPNELMTVTVIYNVFGDSETPDAAATRRAIDILRNATELAEASLR